MIILEVDLMDVGWEEKEGEREKQNLCVFFMY